jgi:hypothetical protein
MIENRKCALKVLSNFEISQRCELLILMLWISFIFTPHGGEVLPPWDYVYGQLPHAVSQWHPLKGGGGVVLCPRLLRPNVL